MRKANPHLNKQNRYDQMTNFAIDLQGEVNRSIVFPKIASRMADNNLRQFVSRKKQDEDEVVNQLREEVDRLKRQMFQLQESKYLSTKMRTEPTDRYINQQSCQFRDKQMRSHHHCQQTQNNLRNSEDIGHIRLQRNTEKMGRCRENETMDKRSEIQMGNLILQTMNRSRIENKLKLQSKATIEGKNNSYKKLEVNKMQMKKKKHKPNPRARRRLRSAILAVYFSIYLPSFARKIYQNKLKMFMSLYPYQISKYLNKKDHVSKYKRDQYQIWSIFQESMNIMEEVETKDLANCLKDAQDVKKVKVHFQFLINEELNSSQKDVKQHLTEEQQLMYPKNVDFLMGQLNQITTRIVDSFVDLISQTDFVEKYWRTLAQGLLSHSFINNSRPKLLSRVVYSAVIKPHPVQQTILIADKDIEITLLTFDIFCRIFCYRWMAKLHRDKIAKKYSQRSTMVCNFLLSTLYLIGEMLIDQKVKICIKTGLNLTNTFKVNNRRIRPIIPLSVKKKYKGIDTQTKRLIADPPLLDEASTVVLQNQEIIDKIKTKMLNAGTELYQRLKIFMKEDHKAVKQSTSHQTFIIHGDKKRPQNLLQYQKEEQKQPKQSKISINYNSSKDTIESRIFTDMSLKSEKTGKIKMAVKKMKSKLKQ